MSGDRGLAWAAGVMFWPLMKPLDGMSGGGGGGVSRSLGETLGWRVVDCEVTGADGTLNREAADIVLLRGAEIRVDLGDGSEVIPLEELEMAGPMG